MSSVKHKSAASKKKVSRAPLKLVKPDAKAGELRDTGPYRSTDTGLVLLQHTRDGIQEVPLTNFHAEIVGDLSLDDGENVIRALEINANISAVDHQFQIPAAEFPKMSWPIERIGAKAIIAAGNGPRDHARAAIQHLSRNAVARRIYTHTGWRKIGGVWVFLHAGGGIGPTGAVAALELQLPEPLANFRLPSPPRGKELLRDAIRATLRITGVTSVYISIPCIASAFRVVLGGCDLSVHIAGRTGTGKSELAALIQQHFGARMNARHLPGNWSSTANALEALCFAAKDCVIVVDDFLPTGTTFDVQHLHREADRLFRNQGNQSGRQRLNADSSLKPTKTPRGLIVSTGEDTPRGQSLRARIIVLELSPTSMNWGFLTACQRDAAAGKYAVTMAAFLQWVAGRYDAVQSRLRREIMSFREKASASGSHRRTPEIVANLAVGLTYFLDFAVAVGAITNAEAQRYRELGWNALGEAARAQEQHQVASEPAGRFVELLAASLGSGGAHLAGPDGAEPKDDPQAFGWRLATVSAGEHVRDEWRPQGSRVGWVQDDDVFLNPDASFKAVQVMAKELGDALTITSQTLRKRLHERGLLASTDQRRETFTTRKTLEGRRREVLHMKTTALFPEAT